MVVAATRLRTTAAPRLRRKTLKTSRRTASSACRMRPVDCDTRTAPAIDPSTRTGMAMWRVTERRGSPLILVAAP
jgi:hypothetical protein